MNETETDLRENVREYYAERARQSASCCGPQESGCGDQFYAFDSLADLPDDVTGFSLGCGDPITAADLQKGETVLDLGSGGGLDCFLAARQVGESGSVIGVDMTPEMLSKARQMSEKLGFGNVEFRQGYLEELPIEDGSMDVVISNCVINLSPEKASVFGEMFRVLKPGGRISVSDIVRNGNLADDTPVDVQSWSACEAGALSVEEYLDGLEQAGFKAIDIKVKGDADAVISNLPENIAFSGLITAEKPL